MTLILSLPTNLLKTFETAEVLLRFRGLYQRGDFLGRGGTFLGQGDAFLGRVGQVGQVGRRTRWVLADVAGAVAGVVAGVVASCGGWLW